MLSPNPRLVRRRSEKSSVEANGPKAKVRLVKWSRQWQGVEVMKKGKPKGGGRGKSCHGKLKGEKL